jgi:hypothetical protein
MSDSKKAAPREEAKVRVRHVTAVDRDGVHYPAGSFEEDLPEAVATSLAATGRVKRLSSGDLRGDTTPTEGADHTVARPPGYEAVISTEAVEFGMDRRAAAESRPAAPPADKPKA